MSTTSPPSALLFDVFGTVVDWRSTVTNALITHCTNALSAPDASLPSTVRLRASTLTAEDWSLFAQQWRNSYLHFTRTHDPSTKPFITIDAHHLSSLHQLLHDRRIDGLWADAEIHRISLVWHQLRPWADSRPGLDALNTRFATCTLSNGNVSLLTDMASHAALRWTHVFSAEHFGAYKPSSRVYEGAAAKLRLEPRKCAMVAAHLADLKAAKACGFQTVYVERVGEEGWSAEEVERARREGWVDMWVGVGDGVREGEGEGEGGGGGGFLEVARRFGIVGMGEGKGAGGGVSLESVK